jgi:predicted nucleotidyltransferase component of viral defense system
MLHYRTIDTKTLELLKNIQEIEVFKKLLLVGGTSLALQIGHRTSIDLDLFGEINIYRDEIIYELNKLGDVKTLHFTNNINIFTINGIKVDIVNYSYPWLQKSLIVDKIKLASIQDIAAMKIAAITGRGTMKDFIDLFYLLQQFSLEQILQFYEQKYSDASIFMALKSLSYFDDANLDIMPKMFDKINWENIKSTIFKKVEEYVNSN